MAAVPDRGQMVNIESLKSDKTSAIISHIPVYSNREEESPPLDIEEGNLGSWAR